MESEEIARNKWFFKRYERRIELSNGFENIKHITALVHELADNIIENGIESFRYIQIIQQDLYNKKVIPFMVEGLQDLQKIEEVPDWDTRLLLWYVWFAYKRIDEDWQWDENLREYVSRNNFWSSKVGAPPVASSIVKIK